MKWFLCFLVKKLKIPRSINDIDVWKKSIVHYQMVDHTNTLLSDVIGRNIKMHLFKNLKIKTKNVHLFNPPKLNIRNERNMAFASIGILIIGNKICIGWPNCPPTNVIEKE
ncbi:MAG: Unknown protein [uncultured Aureispira sp.]|uniref:Uncharacterized protein n=1 Tax=uncultured Aureispira sp. TaxID=1331704 RepID=A0A6S6TWM3_9BACT|nr:MAG: Unknown protein [uncultured Aureispira sp.]